MSYTQAITRTQAEALIPDEVSRQIMQSAPEQSVVMRLGRQLPNMGRQQRKLPVLSALISGGFVEGDTGLKQTSAAAWKNKNLVAAEIAVIVPIPEAVLDDADYDIWGQIRPQISEEFARIFDSAVLFGTDQPADWPAAILTGAVSAQHTVDLSTAVGAEDDLYDVLLGEGGLIALVEEDGYLVNGHVAAMSMRAKLRGLRDGVKQPVFLRSPSSPTRYELDGEPIFFPKHGAIDPSQALMITGDWSQLVWSIRQDMTYKVLDQAVITDASGNIVYNLAQQDMVALRAVMRIAWQLPNPINRMNEDDATRYPFAVLTA